MADFAIYWPDFPKESRKHRRPVFGWNTRRDWLYDKVKRGDRLWLFTSADKCGQGDQSQGHLGYLAEVFFVEGKRNHPRHDPSEQNTPKYEIIGDSQRCMLIDPPLLIDELIRQPGKRKDQHIGLARQNPFELDGMEATRLFDCVKRQRPSFYGRLFSRPQT